MNPDFDIELSSDFFDQATVTLTMPNMEPELYNYLADRTQEYLSGEFNSPAFLNGIKSRLELHVKNLIYNGKIVFHANCWKVRVFLDEDEEVREETK